LQAAARPCVATIKKLLHGSDASRLGDGWGLAGNEARHPRENGDAGRAMLGDTTRSATRISTHAWLEGGGRPGPWRSLRRPEGLVHQAAFACGHAVAAHRGSALDDNVLYRLLETMIRQGVSGSDALAKSANLRAVGVRRSQPV
jgi:hypothetical protein